MATSKQQSNVTESTKCNRDTSEHHSAPPLGRFALCYIPKRQLEVFIWFYVYSAIEKYLLQQSRDSQFLDFLGKIFRKTLWTKNKKCCICALDAFEDLELSRGNRQCFGVCVVCSGLAAKCLLPFYA